MIKNDKIKEEYNTILETNKTLKFYENLISLKLFQIIIVSP